MLGALLDEDEVEKEAYPKSPWNQEVWQAERQTKNQALGMLDIRRCITKKTAKKTVTDHIQAKWTQYLEKQSRKAPSRYARLYEWKPGLEIRKTSGLTKAKRAGVRRGLMCFRVVGLVGGGPPQPQLLE